MLNSFSHDFFFESRLTQSSDHPYVYFDNAATTLKPKMMVNAINDFYQNYNANVFRGDHKNSEKATLAFEHTRSLVASYIKARRSEIIFTHNCTDSIYLLSKILDLCPEDKVVNSILEHHSNFLPWFRRGNLLTVGLTQDGLIDLDELEHILKREKNIKLLSFTYVSNVTGNIQPVREIIKKAKDQGLYTLIDASQAVGHFPIDVQDLGCDFLAFSAHKMFGPSGVGVLYGKEDILKTLKPDRLGGGMVEKFDLCDMILKRSPHCFEAGTPAIESIIGFGKTLEFIFEKNILSFEVYLKNLHDYALELLSDLDFIKFPFPIGKNHIPIFTFSPSKEDVDSHYIARILSDTFNIATNAGLHCCQPLYKTFCVPESIRISMQIYNSKEDVDRLVHSLKEVSFLMK